jgi:hypothetical protein
LKVEYSAPLDPAAPGTSTAPTVDYLIVHEPSLNGVDQRLAEFAEVLFVPFF